jgi:hypothetical protein
MYAEAESERRREGTMREDMAGSERREKMEGRVCFDMAPGLRCRSRRPRLDVGGLC